MKAIRATDVQELQDIPNIGLAMARDLRLVGIQSPNQLKGKDGFKLFEKLCRVTGKTHDPCVIDVFLAAIDFMEGAKAKPWWSYTKLRKSTY